MNNMEKHVQKQTFFGTKETVHCFCYAVYRIKQISFWKKRYVHPFALVQLGFKIKTDKNQNVPYLVIRAVDPSDQPTNELVHLRTSEWAMRITQIRNQILVGLDPLPSVLSSNIGEKGIQSFHIGKNVE